MQLRFTGVLSVCAMSVGCVTWLPHLVLQDDVTAGVAGELATAVSCARHGFSNHAAVGNLASAQTDLLSLSSYDKALYEQAYVNRMEWLATNNPGGYGQGPACAEVNASIPRAVDGMRKRYAELQRSRSFAVAQLGEQAASYRPPVYDFGVPVPSGQVTFGGATSSGSQHYLVDVGAGQRLCTVSDTGYARCN